MGLGQGCGCGQLRFFCTSIGIGIIFELLSLRRFLRLTLILLRAFSFKMSLLMAMVASVFVFSFARYVGSFCGGTFVKLPSLGSSFAGESSSSSSKSSSQPGPSFALVTTRVTSSWPESAFSSPASGAGDVEFVWPFCGFSLHVHPIQGFSQFVYPI